MNWDLILNALKNDRLELLKKVAYANSLYKYGPSFLFIQKNDFKKELVIVKESDIFNFFQGKEVKIEGINFKIAPLNHENAVKIREIFEFARPQTFGKKQATFGTGDRLGITTPGHIASLRKKNFKPILAQQSMRELKLANRSYQDVLDDVTWAVFQEGYKKGYGADGDHLKSGEEIKMALQAGFTMITLDCSEHIKNDLSNLSLEEINNRYLKLSKDLREKMERNYLQKSFKLKSGRKIKFNEDLKKIILIYQEMLEFTRHIYYDYIKPHKEDIDFEISIDETIIPTTPQAHYLVAAELNRMGVNYVSLAPKFIGEFQKGIDYIGDLKEFEKNFVIHAEIADHFGHKLSIHSGSDKFSIYPIIGKYTKGRVHIKTSGTNWLQAMRVIATYDPTLYRKIHLHALQAFQEATQYYHVTTNLSNIPEVTSLSDEELPKLFDLNDSQQLIHITYGSILNAKANGNYLFKDKLYKIWNQQESDLKLAIKNHIDKHIQELGLV